VLKSKVHCLRQEVERSRKQLRNAKLREVRAKKRVRKVIEELRRQNLINAELEAKLDCYKGNQANNIFILILVYVSTKRFLCIFLYFSVLVTSLNSNMPLVCCTAVLN